MHIISFNNRTLNIPIKFFLRSFFAYHNYLMMQFFLDKTLHLTTGSSIKSITLS